MTSKREHIISVCNDWINSGMGDECFWEIWENCPTEKTLTPNMVMEVMVRTDLQNISENHRKKAKNLSGATFHAEPPKDEGPMPEAPRKNSSLMDQYELDFSRLSPPSSPKKDRIDELCDSIELKLTKITE